MTKASVISLRGDNSYSAQQERRHVEAETRGSVLNRLLGKSPDFHTAVPKEDHTSMSENETEHDIKLSKKQNTTFFRGLNLIELPT